VQSHENELDRRSKKIHTVEAQLRRVLSGGSAAEPPAEAPRTMRASRDGRTTGLAADEQDDMDDLAPDENIFELRLLSVDLDAAAAGAGTAGAGAGAGAGEDNPATFLTCDFFEHDTQATVGRCRFNETRVESACN
jgi:hypothetical protein